MKLPIYFDFQATTPLDPRVLEAMLPYFNEIFGRTDLNNPSSLLEALGYTDGLLLAMLMQKVSEGEGRKKLLKYLEAIASDLVGPDVKQKDAKMRLDLLLAKYNQLGFQAEIRKEDGQLVLIQRNCPFLVAAKSDPQGMCNYFDEGIMRAALTGQDITLQSSLAHGDVICRHVISGKPLPPTA